jgi:hypothetical protein
VAKKTPPKRCTNCFHFDAGGGNIAIKNCIYESPSGDDVVAMLGELVADGFCHHWKPQQCEARKEGKVMTTKKGQWKTKKNLKFVLHIETALKPDKMYGFRYVLFGNAFVCDAGNEISMKSEILEDIASMIDHVKADGRSDRQSKRMKTTILKYTTLKEVGQDLAVRRGKKR